MVKTCTCKAGLTITLYWISGQKKKNILYIKEHEIASTYVITTGFYQKEKLRWSLLRGYLTRKGPQEKNRVDRRTTVSSISKEFQAEDKSITYMCVKMLYVALYSLSCFKEQPRNMKSNLLYSVVRHSNKRRPLIEFMYISGLIVH